MDVRPLVRTHTIDPSRTLAKRARRAERLILECAEQAKIAVDPMREALSAAFDVGRMALLLEPGCRSEPSAFAALIDLQQALSRSRIRLFAIRDSKKRPRDRKTHDVICGLARLNEVALVQIRGVLSSPLAQPSGFVEPFVAMKSERTRRRPRVPKYRCLERTRTMHAAVHETPPATPARMRFGQVLGALCAWLAFAMASVALTIAWS